MYVLDLESFAVGLITGVAGAAILVSFVALLIANHGADSEKRALHARHRRRELWGIAASDVPLSVVTVSAPRVTAAYQSDSVIELVTVSEELSSAAAYEASSL